MLSPLAVKSTSTVTRRTVTSPAALVAWSVTQRRTVYVRLSATKVVTAGCTAPPAATATVSPA